MKEQIIRLDPDDDIISVREKLGWVRATHVLLVFPDGPVEHVLQRKLDLVLLQREATRLRANLALITRDPQIVEHAADLGIAHFPTVEASHRRHWRMAKAQLMRDRAVEHTPLNPELVEAASRLRSVPQPALPPLSRRQITLLAIIASAVLLIGSALVLPTATIYLAPAANQVTVTTPVIANPDPSVVQVDAAGGVIPARMVGAEVEGQASLATTGTFDQPSAKARGVALFTNLIPDQVTIPAGTIVRTSAAQPVRFVTLADATLPGTVRATVEVPIEALDAGFEGNLPVGRVNQVDGPLSSRMAVTNSEPTRGGDVTVVPAIAPEDFDRLRALLLQQLQQRAYAEMQTDPLIALTDTEFIPIESLTVVLVHSEIFDGYVGQPAEQVTLDMRVTVQGVAIDERLAREVVYARLADRVGAGYQIGPDSLIFRRAEVTSYDDQRRVTFVMQGAGDVAAAIELGRVRALSRGRTIGAALDRLDRELPLAAPPVIEVWPGFWPLMPALSGRIRVAPSGGG